MLFGTNFGNASAYDWRNLLIILAGGGYKHGCYHVHHPENNVAFSRKFVALAQHMEVEVSRFGRVRELKVNSSYYPAMG